MRAATTTKLVLASATILLSLYDFFPISRGGKGTISDVLLEQARRQPALPLALGFLIGHLWWPQD